jgi:hypothetical protein
MLLIVMVKFLDSVKDKPKACPSPRLFLQYSGKLMDNKREKFSTITHYACE